MVSTSRIGLVGENELADILNKVYEKYGFHFDRFGGIEFHKTSRAGDVGLVAQCKKHKFKSTRPLSECSMYPFLFDAKNHKKTDWTAWVNKATDDAIMWGSIGALIYGRVGSGTTLKRFFAMRTGLATSCFPGITIEKTIKENVVLIDAQVFLSYINKLQIKKYEESGPVPRGSVI